MKTLPLKGKTVLITGASTGIGREAAQAYAAAGAHLVLAARRLPLVEDAAREMESLGVKSLPVRCDVTQGGQVVNVSSVLGRLAPGLFDRVARRMAAKPHKKDA